VVVFYPNPKDSGVVTESILVVESVIVPSTSRNQEIVRNVLYSIVLNYTRAGVFCLIHKI